MEGQNSHEIKKLSDFLNSLEKKVQPSKPLMTKIAGIMHGGVERNFEEEGRPKWKPLAKSTIKNRDRKGYWPGKILQMEGNLVRSLTPGSTDTQSFVETNEVYAAPLHYGHTFNRSARSETFQRNRYSRGAKRGKFKKGSTRGKGFTFKAYKTTIPPRPFMLIKEPEIDEIIDVVKDHITS